MQVFLMEGKSELKKELNLLEITLVGIGNILGAGIYVLMGKAAGLAGNMVWFSFLLQELLLHSRPSATWSFLLCIQEQALNMNL